MTGEKNRIQSLLIAGMVALLFLSACTAAIRTAVHDENGMPVRNAVIFATEVQAGAKNGAGIAGAARSTRLTNIEVSGRGINPKFLPVQVGTSVSFCNKNSVQHQIYSISPTKQFRLTVDKDTCSPGMTFERPGTIVMGSAIDDQMVAYIYVVDTPWFATTGEDGRASLEGLPQGTYDVRVWHPAMKRQPEAVTRRVISTASGEPGARFQLYLRSLPIPGPQPMQPSPPAPGGK